MEIKNKKAKNNIYLLSFLDTADRLDILLLEVRHLQQSIIDSLHAPTLYLPLRYEEKYIFGGWEKDARFKNKSVAKIASKSIIRFPSPRKSVDYWSGNRKKEKFNKVEKRLLKRIGEIWTGDVWVRGERQHYHALRALQVLKQQMFRDKVQLFRDAKNAGLLDERHKKIRGLEKPAFLILRRGIHFRIERYISSLQTQQQNFGKSLDFGLQRYPRPSIDRRREIGIFNDFLSNRTIDLRSDALHLITQLTNSSEEELSAQSPMLLHGWSQLMHVRNRQLWDNVGRESVGIDPTSVTSSTEDICYIDTSFWSPDRPDLQPLVSREIAYSVLRNITKGFSDDYFSNEVNPLTELWVTLSYSLTEATKGVNGLENLHKNSESLLRNIVTDCLAVSAKGISYLYALYLSSVGVGLENLLRVDRIIRLEAAGELVSGLGSYEEHYMWYFRLKFTSFWLREVSGFDHLPISDLDNIVFEGIDDVCEELINFLDTYNISATRNAVGEKWREIYQQLEDKTKKSKSIAIVKEWRKLRSKDTWDEACKGPGAKVYHRSTMRLDVRLQNFLFRETIRHKVEENKSLYGKPKGNLPQEFCDAYGLKLAEVDVPYMNFYCHQPKNIYRQLHDIPFQCSVIRSIDMLGRLDGRKHTKPRWIEFVQQAHEDMSLGREIFSFALEFYTWGRESPKSRLLLSVNLLSFMLPLLELNVSKKLDDIVCALRFWLYAEVESDTNKKRGIADSVDELMKIINSSDYKVILRNYANGKKGDLNEEGIRKLGAIQIDDAFSRDDVTAAKKRRLEQVSGYKLKELLKICERCVQPFIDDVDKRNQLENELKFNKLSPQRIETQIENLFLIGNLREFLRIRDDSKCKPAAEGRFYKLLLKAFGGSSYREGIALDKKYPKIIKPVVVTRLALTSFYTVANPKRLVAEDRNLNLNALGLADVIVHDGWLKRFSETKGTQYSVLLGRYDAVSFTSSKLPCRCKIGHFPVNGKIQSTSTNIEDEAFMTHFSRREIAFPLEVYGDCEFDSDEYSLYAIASISLQRRSMRLNLLYRLLNARYYNEPQKFVESGIEFQLNKLIGEFNNSSRDVDSRKDLVIKALLTDGWGDLLLVFMCRNGVDTGKLHENLLTLQLAFYEDFMVDRTELIYTPQCLDQMAIKGNYYFNFSFRFQEDRKLECSIQNFVKALNAKESDLPTWVSIFDIVFVPGQYDVRVNFHIDKKGNPKNIYKELIQWFSAKSTSSDSYNLYNNWYRDGLSFIDKIETGIEKSRVIEIKKATPQDVAFHKCRVI